MKEFFTKNLGLKVFSLVLAVLLELYFYGPENSVTLEMNAPIAVHNLPQSMMIVWPPAGDSGYFAKIIVRGPAPLVEQLRNSQRRFSVRLPDDLPPNYPVVLNPQQLDLPAGVEVIRVEPASMNFRFDRVMKKEIKVRARIGGTVADGYQVDKVTIEPGAIMVSGPVDEIQTWDFIDTQRIDVTDLKADRELQVGLIEPNTLSKLSTKAVTVHVHMRAEAEAAGKK